MKTTFALCTVLSLACAGLVACGSDSDDGAAAPSGDQVDGGTDTKPDAAPPAPTFVSNTPNAAVRAASQPRADLVLVSSNFKQEASESRYYREWLGIVYNAGRDTVCQTQAEVSLRDTQSAELVKFSSFVRAPAFKSPSGAIFSLPCVAPGERGVIYSNGFGPSEIAPTSVAVIDIQFEPSVYPGVIPHPDAPAVSGALRPWGLGGRYTQFAGSVTGGAHAISSLSVTTYPLDDKGLAVAQLDESFSGGLAAGETRDFDTVAVQGNFTKYIQFVDLYQ
ncbi:hypothetical protein LVJ94_41895 [Pendulispora rubella]|uniref:Lipoprotein n=1 Tax=Pendulispora rubella TaxID=2741070 RepID=A0ABZ2L2H2_9BACT